MKNKAWLFGGAAALALLAGGYAFAQQHGRGSDEMRGMQGMRGQQESSDHRMSGRGGEQSGEHAGRSEQGRQGGMNHEGGRMGQGGMGGGEGRGRMNHEGGDRGRGNVGEQHGGMGGMGGGAIDPARLDEQKTRIGVTPAQETAWTKYATTVKEAFETRKSHENMDHAAVQKMSPADRTAFQKSMQDQAREQFDKVSAAAKEFAATLDDAQKQKASDLPGLGDRGPRSAGMQGSHRH